MIDKLDIARVKDSTINQAGGNLIIYNGLTTDDVIAIVKDVVASELSIYSLNAEKKVEERLNQFTEDLVSELAGKVSDRLYRFNEPSLQFAVREAALSYIKSGKESDEKAIIDIMIERVKVDEHTTKQKLIDQAIKIVPTLSSECLAILSLFVFRSLTLTGESINLEKWLDSIVPVLDLIQNVTSLDIEYLKQAGCVTGVSGIVGQSSWLDDCPKQNNLFFRHPVPIEVAGGFMSKYGIARYDDSCITISNPSLLGGEQSIVFLTRLFAFYPDGTIRFKLTNTDLVDQMIDIFNLPFIRDDVYNMINACAVFSPNEVKTFLINRNPQWEKAIELVEGNRLRSFALLPIGAYIGSRQLSLLYGQDITLETFYK